MMPSGLKGMIAEMDRRQQRTHTGMYSLKSAGSFNGLQQRQCLGERNAPCLQILSVTKIAMESLAIAQVRDKCDINTWNHAAQPDQEGQESAMTP
jgi:hypothetical protein